MNVLWGYIKMSLDVRGFTPNLTYPTNYPFQKIEPSLVAGTLSVYEGLLEVVRHTNTVTDEFTGLVDWVNERDTELVDYLNQQIEDFTQANNEFYQKIDNLTQQFIEDVNMDIAAFKLEVNQTIEDYKAYMDEKYRIFTETMTGEFNKLKQSFDDLKASCDEFKTTMQQAFDDFVAEVRALLDGFENEFEQQKNDYEQFKQEMRAYVQGLFDALRDHILSILPDLIRQVIEDMGITGGGSDVTFTGGQGVSITGDSLKTISVKIASDGNLSFDPDGSLRATSTGGSGDNVEAGQGINVQSSGSTQTIAVKLATDSPNLEFDENGGLRATGTGGGGGDTFVAGQGIGILDQGGSKEIYVKTRQDDGILISDFQGYLNIGLKKATDIVLGGVKTGNPEDTGLQMDADGTIRIRRWQPIDISDEQMFFDANLQNIAPSFVIDCKNKPTADSSNFVGYAKFSQNTIESLGLPDRVQIVNWTPEQNFSYNTTPRLYFTTEQNQQISQQNIKFTVSKATTSGDGTFFRNGTGKIQFTWAGYEQIVELDFSVVNADMKLNASTPIKIDGQAITEGGTYTPNSLEPKQIIFVLEDGTEVQQLGDFGNLGNANSLRLTATNDNAQLTNTGNKIFYLGSKNIANGQVTLNYIPDKVGANTADEYTPLINFNMDYSTANLDAVDVQFTNNINNYTADGTLMINLVGYAGGNFNVTTDNAQIIGIGGYGVASKTVSANTTVGLYAGRTGTANITITASYESDFTKTIQVKVAENIETQAHVMVMSNSNTLNDTSLDIAHPANDNSSYTFSKAQGNITFWCKANPLNNIFLPLKPEARTKFKIYAGDNEILKIENHVYGGPDVLINGTYVIDFSNLNVGSELFVEWSGDTYVPYYKIKIGQVVD